MRVLFLLFAVTLTGCQSIIGTTPDGLPSTLGERSASYGYIPLDGLAIEQTLADESCSPWRAFTASKTRFSTATELTGRQSGANPFKPLLESLPDISVRFAVASVDASGGLTFGPAKITAKNGNYKAVLDYVNVDAIPVTFWISAIVDGKRVSPSKARHGQLPVSGFEAVLQTEDGVGIDKPSEASELVTIPVYVGVGMRLSADIAALEGGVPLTSLGVIGLEAQAKRLIGTLSVQTIGIAGESVATSLPLPSKLDQTTIENGILSIGSSRAVVYRRDAQTTSSITTPRVVGLYSPIGSDPALVNAIYSELSRKRPQWARPCRQLTGS